MPQNLTNDAVRGYKQYLLDQPAKPKTINRRLAALAAYAHWLELAGYVINVRNPVQGIKAVRETILAPKWLDKKQRAALLRSVDKEVEDAVRRYPRLRLMYVRDAAIVKLILYTGLTGRRNHPPAPDRCCFGRAQGEHYCQAGKGYQATRDPAECQSPQSDARLSASQARD